jgi:AraC-like DNA-binding protein
LNISVTSADPVERQFSREVRVETRGMIYHFLVVLQPGFDTELVHVDVRLVERDEITGEVFTLKPGLLVQHRPGASVSDQFDTEENVETVYLAPPQTCDFLVTIHGEPPACRQVNNPLLLYREWARFAASRRNITYSETMLAMPALFSKGLAATEAPNHWHRKACEQLAMSGLPLEESAPNLGMSYASFRTNFREEAGIPPAACRRKQRMARALFGEPLAAGVLSLDYRA